MRIGYIGLSTPLFYDYKNPAQRSRSDLSSSPNPILDSPFGTFILFDEIWFLCPSLCPQNMRSLPYVKFLDSDEITTRLINIDIQRLKHTEINYQPEKVTDNFFARYWQLVAGVGVHFDAATDNHTHTLQIGPITVSANSASISSFLFDLQVLRLINRADVELITNSVSQRWLESTAIAGQAMLTHSLILDGIPNYLSPSGPYHPCVEEVRANSYLSDFRRWVSDQDVTPDSNEVALIKQEVENEIKRARNEVFLKYLSRESEYLSVGKTVFGTLADLAIPGISVVMEIGSKVKEHAEIQERRWQGFVLQAQTAASTIK
jgi:hypothetical protein